MNFAAPPIPHLFGRHDDDPAVLLPHHLPEVVLGVRQAALRGDVRLVRRQQQHGRRRLRRGGARRRGEARGRRQRGGRDVLGSKNVAWFTPYIVYSIDYSNVGL